MCWRRRKVLNVFFNKLDQLKPNIQWWESGAQPLQWLVSGDVVMGSVYNGRVGSALKEGHDFRMVWTDSIYDMDSWTIVKGSKKKVLAEQFIAFANLAEIRKSLQKISLMARPISTPP